MNKVLVKGQGACAQACVHSFVSNFILFCVQSTHKTQTGHSKMANLTAHDNESINSSDSGYFSFIHRYTAVGVARFAVAGFKLLCQC